MRKTRFGSKKIIIKAGTIVDATIPRLKPSGTNIAAPSSTKNEDKKRDEEMSSTKTCPVMSLNGKGGKWHFGMKAHIGVDTKSGLVHSVETTTAGVHDSCAINLSSNAFIGDKLLHGEEKAVLGDKGYANEETKASYRAKGIYYGILDKAKRNQSLSSSQNKRNRKLSSIRAKVEHPFQVIKCQWKYTKTRYKGLIKNTLQLWTLFALYNLFKARRILMQPA